MPGKDPRAPLRGRTRWKNGLYLELPRKETPGADADGWALVLRPGCFILCPSVFHSPAFRGQAHAYIYPELQRQVGPQHHEPDPAVLRTCGNLSFDLDCSLRLSFNLPVLLAMTRSLETQSLVQSPSSRAVRNHAHDACKTRGLIVFCQHPGASRI